jgi:flagellar biosynthesis protein FlhA
VEELVPALLQLAEIQRVLQGLLAEQVPINDLPRIYEALSLTAKETKDPESLIESARTALGPALGSRYLEDGTLRVLMFEPLLEQSMLEALRPSPQGTQISMDMNRIETILSSLKDCISEAETSGAFVLVCAPALRPAVRRFLMAQAGGIPVLSYQEAAATGSKIDTVGVVRGAQEIAV